MPGGPDRDRAALRGPRSGGGRISASEHRPHLLLVEDDPELGPLMADVLGEDYAVTLVPDGDAGLEAARTATSRRSCSTAGCPAWTASSVVRGLRSAGVATPGVMLTALGAVSDRVEGLDAGADDYLVKPFDFAELRARLRALRRVHGEDEDVVYIGDWEFRPANRLINSPYEGRKVLTETETHLLSLLAQHPARRCRASGSCARSSPSGDSVGTVDTYVHYIRRKTERDIITTVRGRGYRLGPL